VHVVQRFERLLDAHRRPDGSRWTGQKLDEATGGVVTHSYVTNLRKGRIENPGYEKMLALAKAMGFPPEAWFEDTPGDGTLDPLRTAGISPRGSGTSSTPFCTRGPECPTPTPRSPA
jgi:hypothetical protein